MGLSPDEMNRYPHELSSSQQQRFCIGWANVLRPKLLVCGGPVSALDVSIQAQILNSLSEQKERLHLSDLLRTIYTQANPKYRFLNSLVYKQE